MFEKLKSYVRRDAQPALRGAEGKNDGESLSLDPSLEGQISLIEGLFADVDVMITRRFQNLHSEDARFCLFYCDGLVDTNAIQDFLIKPLMNARELGRGESLMDDVVYQCVTIGEAEVTRELEKIITAISYGDTVLCMEGARDAVIFNSKGFTLRSVSEPESERVLSGPREGFNEGIMNNLSLIRRRLVTNELKMKMRTVGRRSRTKVCVCYMEDLVNRSVLADVLEKLDAIDIDGILDSNYVSELISPISFLGFATCGVSERPDIIAAKLLEGRVAILVDGSPAVLTVPYLLIENFQSNEDYYVNRYYATFSRILRIFGFFFTITVPGAYVAVVTHHHELIPTQLLIDIAAGRMSVPLPAGLECLLMLLVFDILRETGIRMPTGIGQALSIVGALVIGQSAVEAGLVAAPMIIVVAFAGLTNLLVPRMSGPSLVCRYGLLLLSAGFGLLGFIMGMSVILTHIINLQSFGMEQILPAEDLSAQNMKDTFVRSSWKKMLTRISPLSENRVRARDPDAQAKDVVK